MPITNKGERREQTITESTRKTTKLEESATLHSNNPTCKVLILKSCRLADWNKKQDPTICCVQETHVIGKDT